MIYRSSFCAVFIFVAFTVLYPCAQFSSNTFSSNPFRRKGLDENLWMKRRWTKINWTKSMSTVISTVISAVVFTFWNYVCVYMKEAHFFDIATPAVTQSLPYLYLPNDRGSNRRPNPNKKRRAAAGDLHIYLGSRIFRRRAVHRKKKKSNLT